MMKNMPVKNAPDYRGSCDLPKNKMTMDQALANNFINDLQIQVQATDIEQSASNGRLVPKLDHTSRL